MLGDVEPALPSHILLGQHTVNRHHVQSVSMLPACLKKPFLLRTAHIKTLHSSLEQEIVNRSYILATELIIILLKATLILSWLWNDEFEEVTWESSDWQASTPARVHWRRCRFSIITWPNRSLMFTWTHSWSCWVDEAFTFITSITASVSSNILT